MNDRSMIVYENKNYAIKVGIPPKTPDFPEPFEVYLIVNKTWGVTEYFHQVLPYAIRWADQFNDILEGKPTDPEKVQDQHAAQLFN